ncbi:hypothetical protein PSAC2689_160089 [Paraburkholderia sacchari]
MNPAETNRPLELIIHGASKTFRKLPAPVLPGSGAKGLSQPHGGLPVKHPCFVSGH